MVQQEASPWQVPLLRRLMPQASLPQVQTPQVKTPQVRQQQQA
jgi:hypothetical protein